GGDGIRPDVVRPQVTGQSTGESMDGRLARRIGGHATGGRHPRDRAEIDDGAAAQTLHLVHHRLGGEELMAEIDGDPLIPEVDGHALDRMAIVARGVVHENADIAALRLHGVDGRAQEIDLADVAWIEAWSRSGARQLLHQVTAGRLIDIHEADLGALAHESFDDGRADARSAAGDKDDLVLEAGVDGETAGHAREGVLKTRSRSACSMVFEEDS